MSLVDLVARLAKAVDKLTFAEPVAAVYNPLQYARSPMNEYLTRYGTGEKEVLLIGMNPGPFGMAQTGVPFGDVTMVRDWLDICEPVLQPKQTHPKRPVLGFDCDRREVSGERLWGWARGRYVEPKKFFKRFFVWNYCPLCFLESSGRNRTPDKLPVEEREALYAVCDPTLGAVIEQLNPRYVVGVGKFALARIETVLAKAASGSRTSGRTPRIAGSILHPSPASPIANRGWAQAAERDFERLGIRI